MNIIIFTLSLIGLLISSKIQFNRNRKVYHCPISNTGCKYVLNNRHSKTLGVHNDILGIIYFSFLAAVYSFTLFELNLGAVLRTIMLFVISGGFLFSLYLTFIQMFQIKKWCTWCILTALSSTSIFIFFMLSSVPYQSEIINILTYQRDLIIIIYSLGFAIGLGATTVSHISFFRFLKDYKITKREANTLYHQAQVVWLGIIMVTLGGLGLLITNFSATISSPTAVLQLIIILVLIISETLITLLISPNMFNLSSKRKDFIDTLHNYRKKAFAFSGISLISWYLSFLLNYIPGISMTLIEHIFLYSGLVVVVLMVSQIIEQNLLYNHLREESKK